ncbi:probable inactive shikimate kinase like 1, chloroplastic [Impatiens glandulifera]|uniref:probable inactive shikimate kinase like 1, chloroplastic n=1 Tax=Impatiens glandulifera TaxID=253017 RepID=UPI001FB09A06|nr:probable inactive shikimate kinase like 1, chloroplastic [Impatiens glandulifera]
MESLRAGLHFQFPRPSLCSSAIGSSLSYYSYASTSINSTFPRFHRHLQSSSPYLTPKFFPVFSQPDDTSFTSSGINVVEVDPLLEVKKKAAEISSELKGTTIFLLGMNCDIKTSIGELLADGLRYYYFDSDSLVEQAVGGESSEEGFSESETEVLKQLSSMGRLVVCAGDGAVGSVTNLGLLRYGISIWIDVPLEMIATRDDDEEVLMKLYQEMKSGYATADATVSLQKVASKLGYDDYGLVTKEDMILEAFKEIERLMRSKKLMEAAARPF